MHRILLGLLFACLFVAPARAATYYVNSSAGSNSNSCATAQSNGSSAKANFWGSSGALACLSAGDTLKVAPNMTYSITTSIGSSVFPGAGGNSNARITIESETAGQKWTVSKAQAQNGVSAFYYDGDSWITMRDFIIDFNKGNGTPILVRHTAGASTNNIWEDFEIRETGGANAIALDHLNTGSNIVRRCLMYDLGTGQNNSPPTNQYHGIYIESANNLVEHCEMHTIAGYGVHIFSSDNGATEFGNNIIRYNRIHDSTSGIHAASTNQKIYRNVIYDVKNAGIQVRYNTPGGSVVEQNTIARTTGSTGAVGACIQLSTSSSRAATILKNNICYNNAVNTMNILSDSTGTITQVNNLHTTSSSHFINATGNDFNLASGSAAIDGGTTPTNSSCNGTCDQGAFEAPTFASCSVEDGDATKIRVVFTTNAGGALQGSAAAQWAAVVNGAGVSESAVTIVGTSRIDITVPSITGGQTVTIAYTLGTLTDSMNIGNALNSKVRSFTAQSCTNNVGAAPAVTFQQIHFGFYEFFGTEASGPVVFSCGEDANCTFFQYAATALRLKMKCNGGNCDPKTVGVRYSLNGGAYTDIPNVVGADKIYFNACPNMAHGSPTTERLTSGAGGFVAGSVLGQLVSIPNVDLAENDETEFVFCISWIDATVTATYDFRLYDQAGNAIDTYTVTPRATIGYPTFTVRQP